MAQPPFLAYAVQGAEAVDKVFAELGQGATRQVLTAAAKEALKPVATAARGLAPASEFGPKQRGVRLKDSIVVSTTLSKSQMRKRGGKRAFVEVFVGSNAAHAHLVEFGHALVKGTKGRGDRRVIGHVPPHPFLRPAWDSKKAGLPEAFAKAVGRHLERLARRVAGQVARGKLTGTAGRILLGSRSRRGT